MMYKYQVGEKVRIIKESIYKGHVFLVEEDGRQMSDGLHPEPEYYYHGHWLLEEDLELV